jgi:NADH dehydrogenase
MPQNDLSSDNSVQGVVETTSRPRKVPRVVVLGGGSVGLYVARRLR